MVPIKGQRLPVKVPQTYPIPQSHNLKGLVWDLGMDRIIRGSDSEFRVEGRGFFA